MEIHDLTSKSGVSQDGSHMTGFSRSDWVEEIWRNAQHTHLLSVYNACTDFKFPVLVSHY